MAFSTIAQLLTYINQYIIPNGENEITGLEDNTAFQGVVQFIQAANLNNGFVHISSTGGVIVLPAPMTLFTTVLPTSIQWNSNFNNEYYIVNGLGVNIPLANGFSYIDPFGTSQTVIPSRTAIHIAQATNGSWIQMNNVGGGSGSGLPPMTGHAGQVLTTNGTTANWFDGHISLTAADFQADGQTYLNPILNVTNKVSVFWSDLPNFLYESKGDWSYVTSPFGIGIKITAAGFSATANPNVKVELFFKGINAE
jgi:hypothetical protein